MSTSETITKTDLANILNEIVAIDGTDMTSQEIDDFVDSLNITSINAVDYVVEQGATGGWVYRKWNSGKAECWKTTDLVSYAMTTAIAGNGYTTDYWTFPSGLFTDVKYATANRVNGGNGLVGISIYSLTTTRFDYYVYVVGTTATMSIQVAMYAFGTWK